MNIWQDLSRNKTKYKFLISGIKAKRTTIGAADHKNLYCRQFFLYCRQF